MDFRGFLRDEEEFVFVMLAVLAFSLVVLSAGFGYCFSFEPSSGCFTVTPFIYGILGLFVMSVFYHLAPYIEDISTSIRSRGFRSTPRAVLEVLARMNYELQVKFDAFLEEFMTDNGDGFKDYTYNPED